MQRLNRWRGTFVNLEKQQREEIVVLDAPDSATADNKRILFSS